MSALFAQLLATALVLAVPAAVSVFVGEPGRPGLRGPYRVLLAAGLGAGAALALGAAAGAGAWRTLVVAGVLGGVVLAFGSAGRPWTVRGLLTWSLTVTAGAAYLVSVAAWLVRADLGLAAFVGGLVLWLVELFVYVLALGRVWQLVDVLARWDWQRCAEVRREVEAGPSAASFGGRRPFVSLHVPTRNEPPEEVIETLERLVALEYDDFEVLVVDNNTDDPELWRPVERFCRSHEKLGFFHLEDWPGHRSGALNVALEKVDPRTELVGVVDADHQVDPDFLARCVPLFADPHLAFVQTPQDHRDRDAARYLRRLHDSDASFDVSQRSRNERDGAVLGGAIGLVRRDALTGVGGWDEWCVAEGAELSLRLHKAGWSGTYVDRSFGRGTMPLTFEALKRQRFRWCFGGVQLLRLHGRSLLPGRRTADNALSLGQRWAYLTGGLQWFGDLAGLLFTGFLLIGAVDVVTGDGLVVRRFSAPLLVGVIALVLLGPVRALALLRRTERISWRESAGALGVGLGVGWVVAVASVRGLVARQATFLRTPTGRSDLGRRDSVRGNVVETLLAVACLAGAVAGFAGGTSAGLAVGLLLVLQGSGYAAAPLSSLAAVRAELTPQLRRRRDESLVSWTRVAPGVRRLGVGPVLAAAAATAVVVLLTGPVGAPRLGDLPGGGSEAAARPAVPHTSRVPAPTGSSLVPLSPLSPLLSSATIAAPTSPTATPAAAVRNKHAAATTPRPPQPSSTPTAAPTSQSTQATTKPHGRPTWLPTRTKPAR